MIWVCLMVSPKCPDDEFCVSCNGSVCESCIYSFLDAEGICQQSQAVRNCLSYESEFMCSECDIGYYLSRNRCIEIRIENCAFVDANEPNVCIACQNSILVHEGACDTYAMCDDQHCDICPTAGVCSYCKDDYSLTPEFTCVPDPVNGCFSTDHNYDSCASCESGFYHDGLYCKETDLHSGTSGWSIGLIAVVVGLLVIL